jgi:para-nitrobenzyl esterase
MVSFKCLLAKSATTLLAGCAITSFGVALAQSSAPATLPLVQTASGRVSGVPARDPAITVFKGVPFAAPPVDNLRFRPPAPVKPWRGVRDGSSFGPSCPQLTQPGTAMEMSEDCLTANVWTGAKSSTERRPVFVWIYGGAFIQGSGANPQFDGEELARKGVIVVTFNYRLGPLGFLASPELSRESGHNASGNYGIMDDVALLKWVQRNIASFGGDPGRVTIGGQSAGAGSVGFLAMSPMAKGLFHRAIAESQVRFPGDLELRYLNTSWRSKGNAEASGTRYAAEHGAATLAQLRAMPWQDLIKGSDVVDSAVQTGSSAKPPIFRPVIDGWVIPRTYSQTFTAGTQHPVLYLAGNNKDESGAVPETAFASMRANPAPPRAGMPHTSVALATYNTWARGKFGTMADEFLRLYPATNDDEAALANNAAVRDNSRISTWLWGRERARTVKRPMYNYFWTHALPGPSKLMRGAFHGSEIQYVFNSLHKSNLPFTDDDRRIAGTMSSYWANFVTKGDPNGPGLPQWPAFDPAKAAVMEVGDSFGPTLIATPDKLSFWERFFRMQDQW